MADRLDPPIDGRRVEPACRESVDLGGQRPDVDLVAATLELIKDGDEGIQVAASRRGVGEDSGHHETSSSGVSSSTIASSVDLRSRPASRRRSFHV